MGHARRALLIGVGRAPATDGLLEPLDEAVEADLRLMASVLEGADYEVEVLADPDLDLIRTKLYEVAGDVPADGTLLLYFTGHGIRVGGKDYLVPANARPPREGAWREPYLSSLLPASISPLLAECKAQAVLWLIDACRTDLGGGDTAFGNSIDNGPPNGGFAVLAACSAGERSGYSAEGSFFTRGLADALSPLTPARTVEEVFELARSRTAAAARRHRLTQTAWIHYGTNAEAATRKVEICEGRPLLETWLRAARETPLWERVRPEDQGLVPEFRERVAVFVEQCARTLHLAQGRLPRPDPWSDEAFPVRLIGTVLPRVMPESRTLSAVEVALLAAAPFLREASWADRLSQAVEIDPYGPNRPPGTDAHRRHYEQVRAQHSTITRKGDQCRARGRTEDETAVAMWLVHRWIADRFETDDEPVPTSLAEPLVAALGVTSERVREVAELLCAAASAISLDEPPEDPSGRGPGRVVLPDGPQPLRMRPLAALLRLAGVLSVDVRMFPEIAAEHLAVTDPVLPQHIVAIAHGLSWEREDSALHLDAPCPHQAVHAALAEITEEADQLAARIRDRATELPGAEACLLTDVPRRVTARSLRPARTSRGAEPYDLPLLRFHLSQSEVRELLMGEQLYGGDPTLALRELYQNAMDACRYRAMRWKYLTSSGARPADWNGRITFTQGEDERGRYVEARDNGVGMSAELLTHTFTRAGSRFERSKAFRREQSRWLRHDRALRLYPNSRFGIGVFSYFMLADEMTIVTRPVSPDGIPAEHALRVDIPGSASLFRIRRHTGPEDGLAEGGTRVRLYLREGAATEGLSCTRVLRELVRLGEFEVETLDEEGHGHRWRPGELQPPVNSGTYECLTAIPDVLWWVDGEGAVLCDGVATDQKPFGYVLNLTGPHAGRLSVSRTELQDFDRGWAEQQWRTGAEALSRWSGLTVAWTAELERRSLRVAQVLDEEWRGKGVMVTREDDEPLSLDEVGWFRFDEHQTPAGMDARIDPWRRAVLRGRSYGDLAPPRSLTGFPVPAPGDADVMVSSIGSWRHVAAYAARHDMTLADLLHRMRKLRIAEPGLSPPPTDGAEGLAWVPSERDALLADALRGRLESENSHTRVVKSGDRIDDLGGLVLVSAALNTPLGELTERLARLAPLHGLAVPTPPDHHVDHVCTEDEIRVLFVEAGYQTLRRVAGPADIRAAALTSAESDVLARLKEFSWLGWTTPSPVEWAPWSELEADNAYFVDQSVSRLPDGRFRLDWAATIYAADLLQISLAAAEQRVAAVAADLGLVHEPRYGDGHPAGRVVPSPSTVEFVDYHVRSAGRGLERGVNLRDLIFSETDGMSTEEAVAGLRAMGVSVPEGWIDGFDSWNKLDLRTRYALAGNDAAYDDYDFPAEALTTAVLVNAAALLQEPLGEVWSLAAQQTPVFGLDLPPLPPALADHRPSESLCDALGTFSTRHRDAGQSEWMPLTPVALARYARRFALQPAIAYQQLCEYGPLGALVPPLTAQELAGLPQEVPDAWDLVALSPDHRGSAPESPYTPLDLVSIAARLGEPISDTVRRITPYLPLFAAPAALPTAPDPDTVPCWQDLTLLTRHFDGRLPAVEGAVTRHHIALAAEATRESEEWIRGRLQLYAGMFGLTIHDFDEQNESGTRTDD
ncbi:caspase family protein [Streptomyces sp. NPDC048523]|uniref:HD domain-containing protein n=1 Tax=Streptomyces sp. NPDC048523 TaxID=3365567 RepID=UPI0037147531